MSEHEKSHLPLRFGAAPPEKRLPLAQSDQFQQFGIGGCDDDSALIEKRQRITHGAAFSVRREILVFAAD